MMDHDKIINFLEEIQKKINNGYNIIQEMTEYNDGKGLVPNIDDMINDEIEQIISKIETLKVNFSKFIANIESDIREATGCRFYD